MGPGLGHQSADFRPCRLAGRRAEPVRAAIGVALWRAAAGASRELNVVFGRGLWRRRGRLNELNVENRPRRAEQRAELAGHAAQGAGEACGRARRGGEGNGGGEERAVEGGREALEQGDVLRQQAGGMRLGPGGSLHLLAASFVSGGMKMGSDRNIVKMCVVRGPAAQGASP